MNTFDLYLFMMLISTTCSYQVLQPVISNHVAARHYWLPNIDGCLKQLKSVLGPRRAATWACFHRWQGFMD